MAAWLRMIGLGVVLAAAAVLSFAALRELAIAVSIDTRLAFLLPIAVDAGAAVSCTVWLAPAVQRDARRFACWLTWSLLGATVVGNAAQLGMHANHVVPPWQVAVVVGAIPPAVVGGVVHLLVLVGRAEVAEPAPQADAAPTLRQRRDDVTPDGADTNRPVRARASSNRSPFLADPPAKAVELAQSGGLSISRLQTAVLRELGTSITHHEARTLLKQHRPTNGHQVTTP